MNFEWLWLTLAGRIGRLLDDVERWEGVIKNCEAPTTVLGVATKSDCATLTAFALLWLKEMT